MIREYRPSDFQAVLEIINDAAEAYRGVIPADCMHDPYMSADELRGELREGVTFLCFEEKGTLIAAMGIQGRGAVALIRHAYVRTRDRHRGIGTQLLLRIEAATEKPLLVGTWAAASWARSFYEKNGYRLVEGEVKDRLLQRYWRIPRRQIETSVVLWDAKRRKPPGIPE